MQILTARYYLEFSKLTLYGITRPQSIRKSKQISGQTVLSRPQDVEFNPNFGKNRDICMVKNSVTRPVTAVLPMIRFQQFTSKQIKSQFEIKSFNKPIILIDSSIFFRYNI